LFDLDGIVKMVQEVVLAMAVRRDCDIAKRVRS
jgi:hypothetical protein